MTNKQITLLLDGEAWMEYSGNLYEYIGEQDGKHLFSDINDGYPLPVSDMALRKSTEFFYTEKY
jgi:hypothetical protein